jgi:hypothetical protein
MHWKLVVVRARKEGSAMDGVRRNMGGEDQHNYRKLKKHTKQTEKEQNRGKYQSK